MGYLYVLLTIAFTVYGQLVLKWQVAEVGPLPASASDKILHLLGLLLNPWIISGFAAAFLASLAWMAAMTKFELSHAYPFMSASFVLVLILSGVLFNEPITTLKVVGMAFIVVGIAIGSQG